MQLIKRIGQRGDTIVEVLIAIAVISGVLATSYAIVNRNTISYQQASERVDALKLAEEQIELLRAGTEPSNQNNVGPNNRYDITVTNPGSVHTIRVEWEGITGSTENVSLRYKI